MAVDKHRYCQTVKPRSCRQTQNLHTFRKTEYGEAMNWPFFNDARSAPVYPELGIRKDVPQQSTSEFGHNVTDRRRHRAHVAGTSFRNYHNSSQVL